MDFIAKTPHGLESVLAEELNALGAQDVQLLKRAVAYSGDKELLYRSNLHLRSALRILCSIHSFRAYRDGQLYVRAKEYPWEQWLGLNDTFAIDSTVYSERFRHSGYVSLKLKDAIVDRFRDIYGQRPAVDTRNPSVRFHVHVADMQFSVSVDSSGESLHKRGYREQRHMAPLNEVLAAGMILLSGWDRKTPFLDPMCGSGTLLAEAGLMTTNTAPGLYRKHFGFMGWQDFDKELWDKLVAEAKAAVTAPAAPIMGSDRNQRAIDQARETMIELGLNEHVKLVSRPFDRLKPEWDNGLIVTNPPYGERLREHDMIALYSGIGDQLKQHYAGWRAWIISSNIQALKRVGLRPSRKLTLFNGALECRFQEFSMYSGSKKASKQANPAG